MSVNFSEVIKMLDTASPFDLYRLNVAIRRMLDDPKRISAIKRELRIGQEVEYFDAVHNAPIKAILLECNKTKVLVQNLTDGKRWKLPYFWLNIEQADTAINNSKGTGLQRHEVGIGEILGFLNTRENVEMYGKVIRLNPKTVTLQCKTGRWKVSYSLLFKVISGEYEAYDQREPLILESILQE
ncbi:MULTISPECIES: hypothetical protein [Methylotuvimicrobium]|uniref:Uncharacterized protein n=2 Tax=Methylotuvimicrobium TaxID=2822410 RepID=G4T0I1_META2|nr:MULTISPECIES: hypothetical protein [Methylotuvimicrobium]QCW84252.1 hypothetical protein EQU24_19970 [Methylotuvimicrobium buryatense]CCE25585.1 conserved protein of unknown function [Methylotuvimicrobium alcaliphilum 20Z]